MNAPHGGDAQKPQGLPVVAVVIGALFFIGLLGLMAYGVMRSGDADRDVLPSALINRPAPDFVLPVLHDPSVTIAAADLRGAPYLLNVWGSWCAACRDEHPVLTKFAETRRVRVVGYNWKDEPADAAAIVTEGSCRTGSTKSGAGRLISAEGSTSRSASPERITP
jgi:cytochrome c biogenesis protein CcmG/thiol:disulfide interchange protein DsbE